MLSTHNQSIYVCVNCCVLRCFVLSAMSVLVSQDMSYMYYVCPCATGCCVLHMLSVLVSQDMSYICCLSLCHRTCPTCITSVLVPQDVSYMSCLSLCHRTSPTCAVWSCEVPSQTSSLPLARCQVHKLVSATSLAATLSLSVFSFDPAQGYIVVMDLFQHVYLCAKSFHIDKSLSAVQPVHAAVRGGV